MKKTYKESSLIELKVGDRVKHIGDGRVGVLKNIKLVPNSRHDVIDGFGLVAILYVKMDSGSVKWATSDKFMPLVDGPYKYDEFYPTEHLDKISNKERIEYLRGEIIAERISYGEIAELQSLVKYIEPDDALLMQWAGVS